MRPLRSAKWPVPYDDEVRRRIVGLLTEIKAAAVKQNRREIGRIAAELAAAAPVVRGASRVPPNPRMRPTGGTGPGFRPGASSLEDEAERRIVRAPA